jgi:erythromycin esterase-like protein
MSQSVDKDVDVVAQAAIPLRRMFDDRFEVLRRAIGDAQIVCIGEESHGTHEFYDVRADITKALIELEGFDLVMCEGDFPPFYDLHRYVGGSKRLRHLHPDKPIPPGQQQKPIETLQDAMAKLAHRYPAWMWHNSVMQHFVSWLKEYNERHCEGEQSRPPVGIYGLDLHNMVQTAQEVIAYLDQADPELANEARQYYGSLMTIGRSSEYGQKLYSGRMKSQAGQVSAMLSKLLSQELELASLPGNGEEFFNAAVNARITKASEAFYRSSFEPDGDQSWNVRDTAMVDTIHQVLDHYKEKLNGKRRPRCVVWAHSSHLGDARATDLTGPVQGQVNIGQLVREQFGFSNTYLIGQTTYMGTVRASRKWDGPDFVIDVSPSLPGSIGFFLHQVAKCIRDDPNFAVIMRSNTKVLGELASDEACEILGADRLERFIGVQYMKESERWSHYRSCRLLPQFDAVIHVDESTALQRMMAFNAEEDARPGTINYSKFAHIGEDLDEDSPYW